MHFCSTTDIPKIIPDVAETITSSITIADTGVITDINVVDVTGNHTYISDLTFSLTAPDGTTVALLSAVCDDTNASFIWDFDARCLL